MPDRADWVMLWVGVAFMLIGTAVAVMLVLRHQREAAQWRAFSAEHCRISGSYDREGRRASNVQAEYELKIYHCDDGSIHVR